MITINKVFIVEITTDNWWNIHKVCATREVAEREKKLLEDKINQLKVDYGKLYGTSYDIDKKTCLECDYLFDDAYEKIVDRFYLYQEENNELKIDSVTINENIVEN